MGYFLSCFFVNFNGMARPRERLALVREFVTYSLKTLPRDGEHF
jgi:hypothetical protein